MTENGAPTNSDYWSMVVVGYLIVSAAFPWVLMFAVRIYMRIYNHFFAER